jgi:ABC-type Fe3+-hydroxamate transport system, periplasmic component
MQSWVSRRSLLRVFLVFGLVGLLLLTGCNTPPSSEAANNAASAGSSSADSLMPDGSLALDYAKQFTVDLFQGGYALITVGGNQRFLTVPEGKSVPASVEDDVVVLQLPLTNILISSTPTMSLINAIGALDAVTLTTTEQESWYIDEVITAMQHEEIAFIGSYREPDYEMIVAENPPFAVFSTMLDSVPEVAAKLQELNVPYLLDQSTFEEHPLARIEWVKLYGVLFDKQDAATEHFQEQKEVVEARANTPKTGETAVIFYITSKGDIYVRNSGDYIVSMLDLAGGTYVFDTLNPGESGTQKLEPEAFYDGARDADYIIYIHNLGGRPADIPEFTAKLEGLADFKAVQNGQVWCTTPNFFQVADTLGYMIADLSTMMQTEDDTLTYLFKLHE